MSTSDSDYSIDWLASDEDDYDSPKRLSPQHAASPLVSLSSSTSSSREPPTSLFHSGDTQRRSDCRGPAAALETPAASPVQGFTSVCTQQTLSVESRCRTTRKRVVDTDSEQFSHKCTELQCYVQPLSSILQGLRSGRYSERLSSFQESVAIDRIQRITGVLQNPDLGGRFLHIVLKIEEMLRSWFPHVKPNQTDGGTPAKKLKHHSCSASAASSSPSLLCNSDMDSVASNSSTSLKWLHTSPICSLTPPESSPCLPVTSTPPARCSQEVTQDSAVSSSSDSLAGIPHSLHPQPRPCQAPTPFKISLPCLERLLQTKDSIITPRTVVEEGCSS